MHQARLQLLGDLRLPRAAPNSQETGRTVRLVGGWQATAASPRRTLISDGGAEGPVEVHIEQQVTDLIGCTLWPSSIVLSRVIMRSYAGVDGGNKRLSVLELGSGCGLVAITFAIAGHDVLVSDKAAVTPLLRRNTAHWPAIEVECFDWCDFASTGTILTDDISAQAFPPRLFDRAFDLVVLSDCLYSSHSVQPLISVLAAIFARCRDTKILLANEQRTALDEFLSVMRKHSLLQSIKLKDVVVPAADLELGDGYIVPVRCIEGRWA